MINVLYNAYTLKMNVNNINFGNYNSHNNISFQAMSAADKIQYMKVVYMTGSKSKKAKYTLLLFFSQTGLQTQL